MASRGVEWMGSPIAFRSVVPFTSKPRMKLSSTARSELLETVPLKPPLSIALVMSLFDARSR
ncbi:hypothetical protein FQZ97_1183730 [compost metagenome]